MQVDDLSLQLLHIHLRGVQRGSCLSLVFFSQNQTQGLDELATTIVCDELSARLCMDLTTGISDRYRTAQVL